MSGTYYLDYSSYVLARTAQLLFNVDLASWQVQEQRPSLARSFASMSTWCWRSFRDQYRVSASSFSVQSFNMGSVITVMLFKPGLVLRHPGGVFYAFFSLLWTWLWGWYHWISIIWRFWSMICTLGLFKRLYSIPVDFHRFSGKTERFIF